MTLAEDIQGKMARREWLRAELKGVEDELIAAGAILANTVQSAAFLRRRGRTVNGDSCRAQILTVLSDGRDWAIRDILTRIPVAPQSVRTQVSRMSIEGDLVRVRHGVVRLGIALPAPLVAVAPREEAVAV